MRIYVCTYYKYTIEWNRIEFVMKSHYGFAARMIGASLNEPHTGWSFYKRLVHDNPRYENGKTCRALHVKEYAANTENQNTLVSRICITQDAYQLKINFVTP